SRNSSASPSASPRCARRSKPSRDAPARDRPRRRCGPARHRLRDRERALADGRLGLRLRAHAVPRRPAGGVGDARARVTRGSARAFACGAGAAALFCAALAAPRLAAQTEPRLPWIGYLANEPELQETEAAARARGLPLVAVPLSADSERRAALGAITSARADRLLVLADVLTIARRAELVTFAARQRIPAVYPLPEFVDAG